jgi:triacylglycerol lipase
MGRDLDKREALFYGRFVLAAYKMFENQNPDPLRPAPDGIPEGYELAAWIHMTDFLFDRKEPKFYGIVVREIEHKDSRIIAIRGTEHAIEWVDDFAALPVPFRQVPGAGRVAYGFDKIYDSLKVVPCPLPEDGPAGPETVAPLGGSFGEQLHQLASRREAARRGRDLRAEEARPLRPTVVTGHSLGSALATLFVMENDATRRFEVGTLCTFASPRVGNLEFARRFDLLPIDSWRIVNSLDIVPKLPPHIPMVLEYDHVDTEYSFRSSDFAKNSLVCWHKMETYLHWLDPTFELLPECRRN